MMPQKTVILLSGVVEIACNSLRLYISRRQVFIVPIY